MITPTGLEKLGFTPNIDFILQNDNDGRGNYIAQWMSDKPQPTTQEIETAHAEWQAEHDAQEYARNRQAEYPEIGDQLDMLWHAIDTGDWTAAKVKTTEFYTALKAVKDANPK
jgi:hypothetical protein